MIAWVSGQGNLLITIEHFHELVNKELHGVIDGREIVLFTTSITMHWKSKDEKAHEKLQNILHDRLLKSLANNRLYLDYNLEGNKAKKYIEEFLEGYKDNFGHIGYGIGKFHDDSDEIINISIRKPPNILQRATGRLGNPESEINIRRDEVVRLKGNSNGFSMVLLGGKTIEFTSDGVREK